MAVTITDTRIIINQADSLTGWTSADSLYSSGPSPVEAPSCIGVQVSNETRQTYFTTTTPIDMWQNGAGQLFYAWALPGGVLDTVANGGVALIIGDGTNAIAFHVGGSDRSAFRHDTGPVFWQCYLLDTGNLPTQTTVVSGSLQNLNLGSISQFGVQFKTLAKSVGGQENCFIDIMRTGNVGIICDNGTATDPTTFLDIATADRQTGNQQAYGALRELGADVFSTQSPLIFGDPQNFTTNNAFFRDVNKTLVFENRGTDGTKYSLFVAGSPDSTNTFILGEKSGPDTGTNGCTLLVPPEESASFIAGQPGIDFVGVYGSTISGFDNGVVFATDELAPAHEVFSTTFTGCTQIEAGLVQFKNNRIINSIVDPLSGAGPLAALSIVDTQNMSDLEFIANPSVNGHAIVINSSNQYEFNNFTFEGYATVDGDTGSEAVYNNSGGFVSILVNGGTIPSVRNSPGSTTVIETLVDVTLTGLRDNTEVRIYDSEDNQPPYSTPTEIAGIENATDGTTNNRSFTFTAPAGFTAFVRTFNTEWIADDFALTVPNSATSIPIAQRRDRVFNNP